MQITFRPPRLPGDYPVIAALLSSASYSPVTAAQVAEEDGYLPESGLRLRTMAIGPAGETVGFAEGFRYPTTLPGKFYVNVVTDPGFRGRGIGSALFAAILEYVQGHGATLLSGQVQDHDQSSLAFLKQRGWEIRRHGYDSVLALDQFDPERFETEAAAARQSGIRLFSLAEEPGEERERGLYRMLSQTMPDIPGNDGVGFMSYETFRRWALSGEGFRPELNILAVDGESLVGATLQTLHPDEVYTSHTSVLRSHRERGIALALKVEALTAARATGVTQARTGNDSLNGPMLAVNRKLGYRPVAGSYELVRRLG